MNTPSHNIKKGDLVVFQLSEVRKLTRTFDEFAYGIPSVQVVKRATYARRVVGVSQASVTVKYKGRLKEIPGNTILGCYRN